MKRIAKSFFSLVTILRVISVVASEEVCPQNVRLLCIDKTSCSECLSAHHCCHWCYNQTLPPTFKCDFLEYLSSCGTSIEINKPSSQHIIENKPFIDIKIAEDASSAIQIRPQNLNVILRKDSPVNISFYYKAAKDYPLELYYLGDLSYSMKSHLETLKNLGSDLGSSLEQLTKHYKMAFGSFLDKPAMPFVITSSNRFDNPCYGFAEEQCDKTYLFKHSLDFTDNMTHFFEVVRESKFSANLDDVDGALEAIFQILVCNRQFGWSEHSRKIILLSTGSLLHTAGDGLLAGAAKVNVHDLCLVNDNGDHTAPLMFDYPSLGHIKQLLNKYKTNLIVASTENKIAHYERMEKDILEQEAFVGVLKNNSENILELVKKGYTDFIRQVVFSVNTSHVPEMRTRFFADCTWTGHYVQEDGCNNVQEGKPVGFKLELSLANVPLKPEDSIVVKGNNMIDELEIHVDYKGGPCQCANYVPSTKLECHHGVSDCDSCLCNLGWTGSSCSEECQENPEACRQDDASALCFQRGDCICGKCKCKEPFVGEFCQFLCPVSEDNLICSGNGACVEGVCTCNPGFAGGDCSCSTSKDQCVLEAGSEECSGKGVCECNSCKCQENYQGTYCEIHAAQNILCEKFEDIVKDHFNTSKTSNVTLENSTITFDEWYPYHDMLCNNNLCRVVYFKSRNERCKVEYCYHTADDGTVHLGVKQLCVLTAQAMGISLGITVFIAIIVGGLILILFRKYQLMKAEKAEFLKFEQDRHQVNLMEMNPLFKDPNTEFRNPTYTPQ